MKGTPQTEASAPLEYPCFEDKEVRRLWCNDDFKYKFSADMGRSGGLLSVWGNNMFVEVDTVIHRSFILLDDELVLSGNEWIQKDGKLPRNTIASFITLIPKVTNPEAISGYKLIRLIGSIYKIVAKLHECDAFAVFRVHGLVVRDKAVCGGVLLMKDGIIRTVFSGPVLSCDSFFPSLVAVKVDGNNVNNQSGGMVGSVPRLNSGGPNRVVTKNAAYLASNPEKKSRAPRNNAGRLEVVPMISVQQAVVVEHWLKSLVLTEQFQLYSGATVNMVRLGFQ
ncbi:hypothetical protein V6N13_133892 [Hibiscus sabdariffa]